MQLNQRREQHYDPIGQSVAKDVLAHTLRVEPDHDRGRRAGDFAPPADYNDELTEGFAFKYAKD